MITFLIQSIKFGFERKFRRKKFAAIVFNGIQHQMTNSLRFVKHHIELQKKDMEFDRQIWNENKERVDLKYKELKSYGYVGRGDYLESHRDSDPEFELLDIVSYINKHKVTPEEEKEHEKEIGNYISEIKASENVLRMLEKMIPIAISSEVTSFEEIDEIFKKQECYVLLNMPPIIDYTKILNDHYYK